MSKPNFSLYHTEDPSHDRTFFVKCVVKDEQRGNVFIKISNGEKRIRLAEHSAAQKILKELEDIYFFSEENNTNNEIEDQHVICLDNDTKVLIKLYKWMNCCEYSYLWGHTMNKCKKHCRALPRAL